MEGTKRHCNAHYRLPLHHCLSLLREVHRAQVLHPFRALQKQDCPCCLSSGRQHVDQLLVSYYAFPYLFFLLLTRNSCYKLQFSSYLQVVYNLSVSKAGYITNIYNIVSCGWGVPVGM